MATDIRKLVPEEAKQDLVDIRNLIELTVEQVVKLVTESRKIDFGGSGSGKSIKDFSIGLKQAAENQQKLTNQTANYVVLNKELQAAENRLTKSLSEENKQIIALNETRRKYNYEVKQEVIANNAAIGSLTHLRAQLNLTKQKYAEMSAEIRDGDAGKALLLQIQAFDAAVKKIEADTGVFARNVGNYNMVQHNMSQVVRELPALGIDFRTFVMAISNNVPMLQESMNQMKASGKTTQQIWQAMAASLFSWNTLLVAGITALMLFSTTASGAETSLGKLNDEVDRDIKLREKATDLYADETTHLKVLLKEITNEATTFERLNEIRDEIVKEYPKTANMLKDEKFLIADLTTVIEKLNEALIIKAQIKAAEELISEKTKEILKGETSAWQKFLSNMVGAMGGINGVFDQMSVNMQHVITNYNEYRNETDRLFDYIENRQKEFREKGFGSLFGEEDAKPGSVNAMRKNIERLTQLRDSVKANSLEYHIYNNQIKTAQKELDKLTKTDKDRETRQKEAKNFTAELLNDQHKAQSEELKNSIEHQKDIAENEDNSYETRINALSEYYDLKKQLIIADAELELMVEQSKIAEIDAKLAAVKKGSKEEKELLAEREALQKAFAIKSQTIESLKNSGIVSLAMDAFKLLQKIDKDKEKKDEEAVKKRGKSAKDLADHMKKVADAQVRHDNDVLKQEEETARKRIELIQKVVDFGRQAADAAIQISRGQTERELENLDREDNANQTAAEREIARIERSALSQEEKEERIAEVQAKADLKSQAIEQRRIDAQRKEAQFQQKIALFKIALSTFMGVAKEIEGKGVAGIVTGGAILAFLGGIASAAAVLAAPAYAEGIENHPGGLAWLGDGGEPELISTPGGKSFFSPATDTLMNLPAGTSVTPMSDLIEESNGMLTPRLLNHIMLQSGGNTRKMEQLMGKVADGIDRLNDKPVSNITIAEGFMYTSTTKGNMKNISLRKNITH